MAVQKLSFAAINFTDWLRVTFAKVSTPTVIEFEDWYDVPALTYLLTPNLSADIYEVKFYDAVTDGDPGTLLPQILTIDGRNPSFEYEKRWYEGGAMPGSSTLNSAGTEITDPYLHDKIIDTCFKAGLGPIQETADYSFNNTTNKLSILNTTIAASGEKFLVIIKNPVGTASGSGGFAGTANITAATYTIPSGEKNYRHRCLGSASTQVVTAPALSALSDGDFIYIDNTIGGTAKQVKILFQGADRLTYNGFNLLLNDLAEFWVRKGEFVKLMKIGSYYELASEYNNNMGERIYIGAPQTPNTFIEDGALYVAAQYPGLMWWITNKLTLGLEKYVDDTITGGSWTRPGGTEAAFFINSTNTHFRVPSTVSGFIYILRRY